MTATMSELLSELISLHERLNELATAKTEAVKKSDMVSLNAIIKEEVALTKKIAKAEQQRIEVVQAFAKSEQLAFEEVTMETFLERSGDKERSLLKEKFSTLVAEITRLKQVNELNYQLIEDSLQFIHLSLDLLKPDISDMNYGRPTAKEHDSFETRSIFDSRA